MAVFSMMRYRFVVICRRLNLLLLTLGSFAVASAAPVISVVDTGGTNVVGKFASQAIVGGNPAIVYYDETAGDLYYVRATNPNGTAWGTPVVVDTNGNVGFGASLEIINGNPAISYREYVSSALLDTSSRLKYVRATDANGSAWGAPVVLDNASGLLTLDTTNSTGEFATSLKLVNGNPAVAYFKGSIQAALGDNGGRNFQFVRATDTNGATWGTPLNVTPNGPSQGYFLRMAIVNGLPLVVDLQGSQGGMERWRANDANGSSWANGVVTPDQAGGSFPLYTGANLSLAMVAGQPAVSYYDITLADLRFTRSSNTNGTAWPAAAGPSGAAQTIVDSTGDVGRFSSLQIFNGFPAMSYYDKSNGDLKYAAATAADGSAWGTPQIIDSTGDVGMHTSQQILTNGLPGIAYFDATGGNLKYAVVNPTITVQQPVGTNLVNGSGSVSFTNGAVLTFTITNSGRINLTLGNFTIDGTNPADFAVGLPGTNALVPGAVTTFTVTFNTASAGSRTATLHLANSDITASPFNIALVGTGTSNVAIISLTNLNQAYTGAACPVTVVTTPTNLAVLLTYNGSVNAPTDAGSYTVVGTLNNTNYTASPVTNTLVISPVSVTVVLTNLNQTYNGSARKARGFTSPGFFPVNLTYNGSPNAPTNAGSYTVVGSVSSPNYTGSPVTNILVINRANLVKNGNRVVVWGYTNYVPPELNQNFNAIAISSVDSVMVALKADGSITGWGGWDQQNAMAFPPGSNYIAASAGYENVLTLNQQGQVAVWAGAGSYLKQTHLPTGLSNVTAVASSSAHGLALKADGTVVAFGDLQTLEINFWEGLLNVPPTAVGVTAIAAGYAHNLALRSDGTVVGWGDNFFGQATPPPGLTNVTAISAGYGHSLALKSDGTIVAWGNMSSLAGTNYTAISAGVWHCLALRSDGTVVAQGANNYGESTVPAGLTNVIAIQAANARSMALAENLVNVGISFSNLTQIYNGTARPVAVTKHPPQLGATVTYNGSANAPTNAGSYTVVGVVNDPNYDGPSITNTLIIGSVNIQFANLLHTYDGAPHPATVSYFPSSYSLLVTYNGSATVPTYPGTYTVIATITGPASDTYSATNTLVINKLTNFKGRKIFAWGYNGSGQCNLTNFDHPKAIAAFGDNSMALNDSGGVNTWGVIGSVPNPAPWGTAPVETIAVGALHALVTIKHPDSDYCSIYGWGDNSRGQSPFITHIYLCYPQIAAGEFFSLGIDYTLVIRGWGEIHSGPLVPNFPMTSDTRLAAGNNHALALGNTGRVYAWGDNTYGQTNVPSGLTNVVAIAAGGRSSLALKNDGTLIRWGYNPVGLFGANNPEGGLLNIPVGLTNVVGIAQGGYHALAIKADGQIIAWGDNTIGQCNVPNGLTNVVAVAAGDFHSVAIGVIDTPITVTIGNLNQVYNGTARSVTASSSPMSYAMEVTYNGSLNAPTNPGNYTVIARVNDSIYTASATNTLVVSGPNNINLSSTTVTGGGSVQFTFTNQTGFTYSVLSTTNLNLPLTDWSVVGTATEISPGSFQFTDPQGITNAPQRFYRIRTP